MKVRTRLDLTASLQRHKNFKRVSDLKNLTDQCDFIETQCTWRRYDYVNTYWVYLMITDVLDLWVTKLYNRESCDPRYLLALRKADHQDHFIIYSSFFDRFFLVTSSFALQNSYFEIVIKNICFKSRIFAFLFENVILTQFSKLLMLLTSWI